MDKVIEVTPHQPELFQSHDLMGCYANIWIRQKCFTAVGQQIVGHRHKYDHMSLLTQGTVEIEADGIVSRHTAPNFLIIRKDVIHTIKALTDDVQWFCLFANRDVNGEVYDPLANDPLMDMESAGKLKAEDYAKTFIEETTHA